MERIVDYKWVNRAHNPHPREFIGGYHTGAVCKHSRRGRLLPMEKTKYLVDYHGNHDPGYYTNSLYGYPLLHKAGHHERKYLLKGREYFVPDIFERPYYIEQCTLNDTITRNDLCRRNPNNAYILAGKLNDTGIYKYESEQLYQKKVMTDSVKLKAMEEKNKYLAAKSAAEKEGFKRAVDIEAKVKREIKAPVYERPIFRKDTDQPILEQVTTTTFETVPKTSTQQVLVPQETTITQTVVQQPIQQQQQPILQQQPIQPQQTTTTTTSNAENYSQAPIYKEEVVYVPMKENIEQPTYYGNNQQPMSYSEVTSVPVHMTSSEFGGGNTPNSFGGKGNKQTQKFRKEIISKQSTDGGRTWTNDSSLAGENVEYIEEQSTIFNPQQ